MGCGKAETQPGHAQRHWLAEGDSAQSGICVFDHWRIFARGGKDPNGSSRDSPVAVRNYHRVPLSDGAVDYRTGHRARSHADRLAPHRETTLFTDDQILGQNFHD